MPELKFNSKIYKKKAIQEAISAYSHLANFSFSSGVDYFRVKIGKIFPDVKKIITDEFSNYVLAQTKRCL